MNRLLLVIGCAVALFAVVAAVVMTSCGQVENPGLIRITGLEHRPATEDQPDAWIVTVVNEHGTTQSFPVTKDRFRRCRVGELYPPPEPADTELPATIKLLSPPTKQSDPMPCPRRRPTRSFALPLMPGIAVEFVPEVYRALTRRGGIRKDPHGGLARRFGPARGELL